MSGGDDRDHWGAVGFLLGYCSELPDMTPADYQEACFGPGELPVIQTVRTAPPPTVAPAQQTLGELIAQALDCPSDDSTSDDWDLMEAVSQMIARHYRICPDEVWIEVLNFEAKATEETGIPYLRRTFACPSGVAALGAYIAHELGVEGAFDMPLLQLSFH